MFDATFQSDPAPVADRATAAPHQRARGTARISVRARAAGTVLHRLHQAGCAKIKLPNIYPPKDAARWVEAVFLNTSGGLTGGDRVDLRAEAGAETDLVITTQACERVYRSSGGEAEVVNTVWVAEGANAAWLPQETILFDGGRIRRRLDVDLAENARFLACEPLVLGRVTSGETVTDGLFQDSWRIRRSGRLIYADETRLSGDLLAATAGIGTLAGARAYAGLVYSGPDQQDLLQAIRDVPGSSDVAMGASDLGDCLVARFVAADSRTLRRQLIPILLMLRQNRPLPRVWQL
ncbi:MAG: urease accessory protein UreD [Alphaproteobacteria bacterium]|nr:urease accessory protein UreD [Alphaproteobacteria bacterium]